MRKNGLSSCPGYLKTDFINIFSSLCTRLVMLNNMAEQIRLKTNNGKITYENSNKNDDEKKKKNSKKCQIFDVKFKNLVKFCRIVYADDYNKVNKHFSKLGYVTYAR